MKKIETLYKRLILYLVILFQGSLFAIINVTDTTSLQNAINTANGAPDTIFFLNGITLTGPLPAVTNTYTIDGNGQTLSGANTYRGFLILGGSPTVQNLGIQNVATVGGAGGGSPNQNCGTGGGGLGAGAAIYVGNGATPSISNVTVTNASATGGTAPILPGGAGNGSGGGGGGLGGAGGAATSGGTDGGAGGGGYLQGDNGASGTPGTGGAGGTTNGGMGASTGVPAIAGGYGGGGGGASGATTAGGTAAAGGYGGGGGAGSSRTNKNVGSQGGFGAGGGGAGRNGTGGTSVYGGGAGGNGGGGSAARGGGGAALGGAIFTDTTSTVTILTSVNPFAGSSLTAGAGANSGTTAGTDLFLASGGNLRFDITAGTVTLSNPIEADTINATGGVEKLGPGILNFSTLTNTYQGSTTITAGTLQFDADTNLGAAAANVVLNGGIWEPSVTPLTSNKAVSVAAPSFINVPAGFTFTSGGLMTGASGYTKTGTGTLIPTGANVGYSGTTTLNDGTIQVSADNPLGTGTLVLNGGIFEATASFSSSRLVSITGAATIQTTGGGTTLTLNGVISGGAVSLNKTGLGTLELGGANTFTVPTTVTAGLLRLVGAGTLGNAADLNLVGGGFEIATGAGTKTIGALSGAGTGINLNNNILEIASGTYSGVISGTGGITKYGAGTLDLSGVNTYTGQSTINGGVLSLSGAGTLGANSPLNIAAAGTFEITAGAGSKTIGTLTGSGGIDLNNNNLSIPDGNFSGGIIGTGSIQKMTPGTLTLSGVNTYSGGTTITDGILIVGADNNFGTGDVTMQGGEFQPTVSFSTSKNFAITGPNPSTINTPAGVTFTLAGTLSGSFPLTKTGLGTFVPTSANVGYSGTTTLSSGTLQVSADNNLGTGPLVLNGGIFEATASFSSSRLVSITGAATIQTTGGGTTLTLNGTMSGGVGSLDKTGAGTLEFGGANTFTVPTTVTAGLLRLVGAGTLGNAANLNLVGGGFEIAAGAG
ncbi:MAG: autotransporter-associated beta strand repeat-containing protein, partial [Chlamydiales bacterium]|nr:autotransporter-associated beta strand repeat-containing protein [Chlamydiales bacterium]